MQALEEPALVRRPTILLFALCVGLPGVQCAHNEIPKSSRPTVSERVEYCEENKDWIRDIALSKSLNPDLVLALIRVESHYNPAARSRAGAMGLMQVMPSTAKGNNCPVPMTPRENVECGTLVLAKFLKRYQGNLLYGLSAYNGGYRMATKPMKAKALPRNEVYVDRILKAKSRLVRGGCKLMMEEF